jgi:hypothetical protein
MKTVLFLAFLIKAPSASREADDFFHGAGGQSPLGILTPVLQDQMVTRRGTA